GENRHGTARREVLAGDDGAASVGGRFHPHQRRRRRVDRLGLRGRGQTGRRVGERGSSRNSVLVEITCGTGTGGEEDGRDVRRICGIAKDAVRGTPGQSDGAVGGRDNGITARVL